MPTSLLLAAGEAANTFRVIESDFPDSPWARAAIVAGSLLVVAWVVWLYLRDTARLPRWVGACLLGLRLSVLIAIGMIALNWQERTQKTSYRQSRLAVLIDTSLSMRFPANSPMTTDTGEEATSRSEAVVDFIENSPFLDELSRQHEVSLYTFDAALSERAQYVSSPKWGSRMQAVAKSGDDSAESVASVAGEDEARKWQEILQPRGYETRLGESLQEAIREVSGQTLSGIILISDGGSNAGVEPNSARSMARAAKPPVRLTTLGVGSTTQPVNLVVSRVQAPTDVHKGDAYQISVFAQGHGITGTPVDVELFVRPEDSDEEPVAVESTDEYPNPRRIRLLEDGIPAEVKFERTSTVAGGLEYIVRAKPTQPLRELSQEDNERTKIVNVIERNTSVLLIAGGPMREYRFVRNMLFRHPQIDVDVWLQTVDPVAASKVSQESDDLLVEFPRSFPVRPKADEFSDDSPSPREYDVVVCFDPDWKRFGPEEVRRLNEWVGTHAGGVILVAGDVYTPELAAATQELRPILELYPVFLNSYLIDSDFENSDVQAWPLGLTDEGRNAGFLKLTENEAVIEDVWTEFPGVFRNYPTGGSKAGATVYAHYTDPRGQTEYGQPILMAAQYYGSGRTLFLGSGEMWRLRSLDEAYYDRLWTKLIREVAQGRMQRTSSRGMLLLDRSEYVLGQTVRLRAQLLNPQLKELDLNSVEAGVTEPSGRPLIPGPSLRKDKNHPNQFAGEFRANRIGVYRIEIPIPESNETLKGRIEVQLPNLESDNPRQNVKLLSELTEDTGGQYFPLDEFRQKFRDVETHRQTLKDQVDAGNAEENTEAREQLDLAETKLRGELRELFPSRGEEFIVDERLQTLWDRDWILWLIVGLLSLEWLTRKLLRLA